jgi:hypothetical protein
MAFQDILDKVCMLLLTKKSTNNTDNRHRQKFLVRVIFLASLRKSENQDHESHFQTEDSLLTRKR